MGTSVGLGLGRAILHGNIETEGFREGALLLPRIPSYAVLWHSPSEIKLQKIGSMHSSVKFALYICRGEANWLLLGICVVFRHGRFEKLCVWDQKCAIKRAREISETN